MFIEESPAPRAARSWLHPLPTGTWEDCIPEGTPLPPLPHERARELHPHDPVKVHHRLLHERLDDDFEHQFWSDTWTQPAPVTEEVITMSPADADITRDPDAPWGRKKNGEARKKPGRSTAAPAPAAAKSPLQTAIEVIQTRLDANRTTALAKADRIQELRLEIEDLTGAIDEISDQDTHLIHAKEALEIVDEVGELAA